MSSGFPDPTDRTDPAAWRAWADRARAELPAAQADEMAAIAAVVVRGLETRQSDASGRRPLSAQRRRRGGPLDPDA